MPYKPFNADNWLGKELDLGIASVRFRTEVIGTLGEHAVRRVGRKAEVYRVTHQGRDMAMKVFLRRFADIENVMVTAQLRRFEDLPGLTVCRREVVSQHLSIALSALHYSVMMPWIDGSPWAAWIEERKPLKRATALALAQTTARVLAGLEAQQLVHADLSSTNVLIPRLSPRPVVELIDVEDMFHPKFADIRFPPDGSPGYQHPRNVGRGCWNPYGDRFAGSVLLTEMLTWHDANVRALRADASLFAQDEIGVRGAKYHRVRSALESTAPDAVRLFDQAWSSSGLRACPTLSQWRAAIDSATMRSGFPTISRFDSMPTLSARLRTMLEDDKYQTSFLSARRCESCGRAIVGGKQSDHAPSCPHHPMNFTPLLPDVGTPVAGPERHDLEQLLGRFHGPSERPRPQFDDITFRPLTASPSQRLEPPPGHWQKPSLAALLAASGDDSRVCPKCGRIVKRSDGKERGHSLTCSDGAVATWWKNL